MRGKDERKTFRTLDEDRSISFNNFLADKVKGNECAMVVSSTFTSIYDVILPVSSNNL